MRNENLILEINTMRSIMGLREKSMLITENIIIGLAKAFGKTAAKHADEVVRLTPDQLLIKIIDDFIPSSAGGGSLVAQKNIATRLKGFLDNLDSAVKVADDAGIKSAMRSILNDADFGATAATKFADDMFADTADDAITSLMNKRVQSMQAQGYADDIIKKQLKTDVGALLSDFPGNLINAAKNKVDTAVDFSTKVTVKDTSAILDSLYSRLNSSQIWNKLKNKDEILFDKAKKYLENLVSAGAKTEDEIYTLTVKRAEKLGSDSFRKKYRDFFDRLPTKYGNEVRMVVNVMIILLLTGGVKAWGPRVKELFSQLFSSDVDVLKKANELVDDTEKEEENKKEENKPTGNCDQTLDSFKAYLVSQNFGVDGATFDTNTCTGAVDGVGFTYDTTLKTWK